MDSYKLKKTNTQVKTYVGLKTFGVSSTLVTLKKKRVRGSTEIANSVELDEDGEVKMDYHGVIPDTNVGKNADLEDHYLNYYFSIDVSHLSKTLKKKTKDDLINGGIIIGLKGGLEKEQTFGVEEKNFDDQIDENIISITKSIKFL